MCVYIYKVSKCKGFLAKQKTTHWIVKCLITYLEMRCYFNFGYVVQILDIVENLFKYFGGKSGAIHKINNFLRTFWKISRYSRGEYSFMSV